MTFHIMSRKEILEKEADCIEEHSPFCTAACPFHLDVRAMAGFMQEGKFEEAAEILYRAVPFPTIVSRTCAAPCKGPCKRAEAGGAVEIPALEGAVIRFSRKTPSPEPYLKLKKTVAVVGAGVSGLAAAVALYEKGFQITVFEKEDFPGGSFIRDGLLTEEERQREFGFLERTGIRILTGQTVSRRRLLGELCEEYDAVYVSAAEPGGAGGLPEEAGGPGGEDGDSENAEAGALEGTPDPDTLQAAPGSKIFVRPVPARGAEENPAVDAMIDGRKAAVSIDRYLKSVSLTANRPVEGPRETLLFTSMEGIGPEPAVLPADPEKGYTEEEARREADRCILCRCMECVKECVYLERFEKYPRKYIREIFNNLSTHGVGLRSAKDLINSCTLCGLCRELCPNSLAMGDINRSARTIMVDTDSMPPAIHDFPVRDMLFSNDSPFSLCRHQPGTEESRYLFFPGCQLAARIPEVIEPVYRDLTEALPGGTGLWLGCCGAPAAWSGQKELFDRTIAHFRETMEKMGNPTLITACPTCHKEFGEAAPEVSLVSLWEILDRMELPRREGPSGEETLPEGDAKGDREGGKTAGTVSLHDPCTSRHQPETHRAVRNLLRRRGYPLEELKFSGKETKCCGYGGLAFYGNRTLAEDIAAGRAEESSAPYVTYCAVCRDVFAAGQKPAAHLLDLLYGEKNGNDCFSVRGAGISQMRKNRTGLKARLLSRLWGEEWQEEEKDWDKMKIQWEPEALELMEKRLILEEEVRQVLQKARETGGRFFNPQTGRYSASAKLGLCTYWVEYREEETEGAGGEPELLCRVYRAYSHRLEIRAL